MINAIRRKSENYFSWDSIGNIADGRKNLGETMPVFIYRLLLFTMKDELYRQFGNEKTIEVFRHAGELAGKEFAKHMLNLEVPFNDFIHQLQCSLTESKIGILRIEEFDLDTGKAILTVGEDLDCSGLPITGETVCNYDEGFLAGILKEYTQKEYVVTEIDCWATGSRVCRFCALVKEDEE
ncbi:V4R domain-containing protein [Oscillospiraceae bacterium PP1C4]